MDKRERKFGFVGLGQMGAPMAINLAKAHPLIVYDKDEETRSKLASYNLAQADQPRGLSETDVLILSLPSAIVVQNALFDSDEGLIKYLKPGTIIVDTGTTEYQATLAIHQKLKVAGFPFIDAPVSGMQKRAEDGTLTMMIGGDSSTFEQLETALSTMASNILHMGQVGSGQLMKLTNQLLFDINAAALAEILPLASKLGLDPTQVGDVVNSGTGRSYASEFFIPHILKGIFENGYPMKAAYKDLVSGADISTRLNIPTPVLAAATSTYQQALLEGHGDKDKGAMILVYERLLGVSFRE